MLYENGEFERIRPHLTPLECGIIFDGIPEGAISRKVGLIWGIPVNTAALRALFDNLAGRGDAPASGEEESMSDWTEAKALAIDYSIRAVKKADWRGNRLKAREVRNAIRSELGDDERLLDMIFEIVKAQSDY